MIFSRNSDNASVVLSRLVNRLSIPVSVFTLKRELQDHPDYPGLLALSDCLTNWKVANEAFRVDKETCELAELPLPFVARVNAWDGSLILVTSFEKDKVLFTNEKEAMGVLSQEEFLKKWDGVILHAEKSNESGENDYYHSIFRGWLELARIPFLILTLLLAVALAIDFTTINILQIALILAKIVGVGLGTLLLMHSLDAGNPFIQSLCHLNNSSNCDAILKSEAAKVTKWLSWSEVGMFYFSGSMLCLIIVSDSAPLLAVLNMTCLPYTFYSIGYQLKIKKWCILCCSVQALLWIEAFIFMGMGYDNLFAAWNLSVQEVTVIILCFFIPVALWSFIKPFLKSAVELTPLKQQLKRFKYDASLFEQVLTTQEKFIVPADLTPIVLGNPIGETVITVVSNPTCGPCALAHKKLDNLLEGRDDIRLNILFITSGTHDDLQTKVSRHLIALALSGNQEKIKGALNDWYGQIVVDLEGLAVRFPVTTDERVKEICRRQNSWRENAAVMTTPTIFINGYELQEPYMLDDLKYLL